jgi:UDP-N-acetylglucosamine 1-carboxyvinyltransferase
MDKILVQGGRKLAGEVQVGGAKNAALPILVASLLCDGPNTFTNVPNLRDIRSTIDLLRHLGANCTLEGHTACVDASGLNTHEAPYDLVRKMRASILVLGPLVARLKKARVSLPGGCAIGARPINLHLKGLECLGARIELAHGYVEASCDRLKGADIYFDVVTVTGTENIMMAAALAEGVTILRNAAREPEITALADVLNRMGAKIEGAGTSEVTIDGVDQLSPVTAAIIPDRIETGTFMAAAALTGSDVTICGAQPEHVKAVIDQLRRTGALIDVAEDCIRVQGRRPDRERRRQDPAIPWIPDRHAGPIHGSDDSCSGRQSDLGNHIREPLHPRQRVGTDGCRYHHIREYRPGERGQYPFRRPRDGHRSAGQRLPDTGRPGGRQHHRGQPGLPSGQRDTKRWRKNSRRLGRLSGE